MSKKKICYVWDEKLIAETDRLPAVIGRASLVHNLIAAYKLLNLNHIQIVQSSPASYKELRQFHSELYLDHLKMFIEVDEEYTITTQDEEYGIAYDCPPVSSMFELVSTVAGGSITAAKALILGLSDVAVNWCGGWHHAQRFSAAGFCYVNDIVLAIETLRRKFPKVLYIDLDVHHGDGVQDAYNLSKSVFTLSIHKYEPGFYPGTGSISDIGSFTAKGYSCNIPLQASYYDRTMQHVFQQLFPCIFSAFNPDAIVVQCGADALAHDPHGGACLTPKSYCCCVKTVLACRRPTLLLGGGGYSHANAARLWASITASITGADLDESIPEHNEWPSYGPGYMLTMEPTLTRDTNTRSYLGECIQTVLNNINIYLRHPETSTMDVLAEPNPKKIKIDPEVLEPNDILCDTDHLIETKVCPVVNRNTIKAKLDELNNKENNSLLQNNESKTPQDVYAFKDD